MLTKQRWSALVCTAVPRIIPAAGAVGRSSGPGVRWTVGLQGALTVWSAIELTEMVSHAMRGSSLRSVKTV